jgi:hypothetical protein
LQQQVQVQVLALVRVGVLVQARLLALARGQVPEQVLEQL